MASRWKEALTRVRDEMALEKKEFGRRLRAQRDILGVSQRELADRAEVAFRSVQRWERGEVLPQSVQLRKLAAALGVEPAYLTGPEDTETTLEGLARTVDETNRLVRQIYGAIEGLRAELTPPEEVRRALAELDQRLAGKPAARQGRRTAKGSPGR